MVDTKESLPSVQPAEKPTVELEKPPAWAVSMAEKMENGFRGLRADVSLVANDVSLVRDRVVILERWKVENEERQTKHSGGLERASKTDEEHSVAIASIRADVTTLKTTVDSIEAKTDLQTKMLTDAKDAASKLWAKPQVKALASAAWMAFVYWLGTKGIKVLP